MKTVLILLLATVSCFAQSGVLSINGYVSPTNQVYAGLAMGNTYEGVVALWDVENTTSGENFIAFCAEQSASIDQQNPQTYTISPYSNADIQELYDRYYGVVLESPVNAIAFQMAMWELLGGEAVSSYFISPAASKTLAIDMVNGVRTGTDPVANTYELSLWSNSDFQNIIQATVVPVPEPGAGLLVLLGAMGLMLRRQRK